MIDDVGPDPYPTDKVITVRPNISFLSMPTPEQVQALVFSVCIKYARSGIVIRADSQLVDDLDFDSLDRVELMIALEDEFAVEIPDVMAQTFDAPGATVQRLIDVVTLRLAAKFPSTKPASGPHTAEGQPGVGGKGGAGGVVRTGSNGERLPTESEK